MDYSDDQILDLKKNMLSETLLAIVRNYTLYIEYLFGTVCMHAVFGIWTLECPFVIQRALNTVFTFPRYTYL